MVQVPNHVAIIMDGNGRWAKQRGKNRPYGHIKGSRTAKHIIEESSRLGIKYLTLYAFSVENWKRPPTEISYLMKILERYVKREKKTLIKQNIRFCTLGNLDRLPPVLVSMLSDLRESTKSNTGLTLNLALSYGGRQDLVQAFRRACSLAQEGLLNPKEINESFVSSFLETKNIPDPDLLIRTSGESRLSNFMLWQCAYSEIYVTPTLWPDFTKDDLMKAILDFNLRERRFGLTGEQVQRFTSKHEHNLN